MNNEFSQSIAELAAGLAHEVKNPLTLVRANIDLLELTDNNNDAHAKNYLVMRRELTRISNLMTDFMRLSRPPEIPHDRVSLPRLLRTLIDDMRPALFGISMYMEAEDLQPTILGDEEALRRVFLNILKNAAESIELADRDDGVITISLTKNDGETIIEIEDNGVGCSEETLMNVNSNSAYYTTKDTGTGLGLYFSRQIIESHGGTLTLHSVPDGALVKIIFPQKR